MPQDEKRGNTNSGVITWADLVGNGGEFFLTKKTNLLKINFTLKNPELHLSVTIGHIGANSILDNTSWTKTTVTCL